MSRITRRSRVTAPLYFILFVVLITACAPEATRTPAFPAMPGGIYSPASKWSLWTGGTQLRGANIYQRNIYPDLDGLEFMGPGPIGPPYSQEDFDRLSELGANYVNISHPGLYTQTPPYILDENAQNNLDALLAMAAQADLFAVITFRSGPGRSDFSILRDGAGVWFDDSLLIESVWIEAEAQAAWVEMWRYTAQRYRENPIVVGYDLMCEPNSSEILGTYDPQEFYAEYSDTSHDWNQLYPRITNAIREVDGETPILIAGNGYSAIDWLPGIEPIEDAGIVYTFHQYAPYAYTHQEPGEQGLGYPGFFDTDFDDSQEAFDADWLYDLLDIGQTFSADYEVPLAVNEYGVKRWAPGAGDFLRDEMGLFEQNGWNYAIWALEASWQPWVENVTDFNFLFGNDPESTSETANEILDVLVEFWGRNTIRPSSLQDFTNQEAGTTARAGSGRLAAVSHWLNIIGTNPDTSMLAKIAESDYDMLVLDYIPSQAGESDFAMAELVELLHTASKPKLVIAYIDIGEAEDYRGYWQPDWRIGNPSWILGLDPDGWQGNFPVAYWQPDWQQAWLGDGGMLEQILADGLDGVYLDWIEAYTDENVTAAAQLEGIDPRQAMITFVEQISQFVKRRCPDCVVIAQNAAELVAFRQYTAAIDALAQEQVWFDGGVENDPQGDCPLPRSEAEIDTAAYYSTLSPACRRQYDEYPDGTLHTSSEGYIRLLNLARQTGIPVFTIDYALQSDNIAWIYQTARAMGFIPFVSNRNLDTYMEVWP